MTEAARRKGILDTIADEQIAVEDAAEATRSLREQQAADAEDDRQDIRKRAATINPEVPPLLADGIHLTGRIVRPILAQASEVGRNSFSSCFCTGGGVVS